MKILGIDPGSRITGFGLIEANKLKFSYINSGCIRTKGDLNDRIITIYEGIKEIIDKHEVDIVVVERVFMRPDRPNPDAAIKLGLEALRDATDAELNRDAVEVCVVDSSGFQVLDRGTVNKQIDRLKPLED